MIKVNLKGIDTEYPEYVERRIPHLVTAPVKIDEQLDTSLDSGTIKYLWNAEHSRSLNEQLAQCSIAVDKSQDGEVTFDFVGMDSRALISNSGVIRGEYSHEIALTEPSKLLQGALIDGVGFSQPEEVSSRATLLTITQRLLKLTPFDYARVEGQQFTLTTDEAVSLALSSVIAPEFRWNTQTTLWECLLQIGAVIDAIPKLVADADGNYTVVTFEFVNAFGSEEENISDVWTNADGLNVDESQFNTALRSIVENLREEDF